MPPGFSPDLPHQIERVRTVPTLHRAARPIGLSLRSTPEDFEVWELPSYLPSGEGEHLYLQVQKRELNTQDAVRRVARDLSLDPRSAGWAGLKDRRARTTQWVSLHAPLAVDVEPGQRFGEQIEVLAVSRHGNKLRSGHLLGNHFRLQLHDVNPADDQEIQTRLSAFDSEGLPNYFGEQRFGREGNNLRDALNWLIEGGRPPRAPFARKMLMSAWQSAIFNEVLARRLETGTLGTAVAGDLMQKVPKGGLFHCEDPVTDAQRVRSWEISPTGPMFGCKMRRAREAVERTEAEACQAWGGEEEMLRRMKKVGEGTRRPLRVRPSSVEMTRTGQVLTLDFTLPAGSYATVLVRELTQLPLWERAV